jgi:hypothetical protein
MEVAAALRPALRLANLKAIYWTKPNGKSDLSQLRKDNESRPHTRESREPTHFPVRELQAGLHDPGPSAGASGAQAKYPIAPTSEIVLRSKTLSASNARRILEAAGSKSLKMPKR